MTRRLEFLDEALEEAEQAAHWYAERNAMAAIGFAEELSAAVAHIERSPLTWPVYEYGTRRFLLRRFPYSVIYRVEVNRIVIVAVAHGHRYPGYWRSRSKDPG